MKLYHVGIYRDYSYAGDGMEFIYSVTLYALSAELAIKRVHDMLAEYGMTMYYTPYVMD
jgi:hypothetical protein